MFATRTPWAGARIPLTLTLVVLAACADVGVLSDDGAVDPHLAAARTAGAALASATYPGYTDLAAAAADANGAGVRVSVETAADVPRFPDAFIGQVAVFGYAWVDLDTGDGIVAVIHPVIGRDSRQNPDGWHTHPVSLAAGAGADFCIAAIGGSQGGISIAGPGLRLNMAARHAGVAASDLDVAAAFIVVVDAGCPGSGLGVQVLDALPI